MLRIGSVVSLLIVAACSTELSPVEKCDDLVEVVCDRGVQCLGGTRSECIQFLQGELACGRAKRVSASYDRCIAQLEANSCSVLFPIDPQTGQPSIRLPADCMEVILVREASASSPAPAPFTDVTRVRD